MGNATYGIPEGIIKALGLPLTTQDLTIRFRADGFAQVKAAAIVDGAVVERELVLYRSEPKPEKGGPVE